MRNCWRSRWYVDSICAQFPWTLGRTHHSTEGTKRVWWVDDPDRVKDFIRQALSNQRRDLVEKIRGMKVEERETEVTNYEQTIETGVEYNQAIDDIIQLLEEK